MTPPILDFKEIVKPDQWVNIPIPLTKAFQYLIENEAWQESKILGLNNKIINVLKKLEMAGYDTKS